MNQGKKFSPTYRFFALWNQLLCMVYRQLTARDSMRDLIFGIEALQQKYYHPGFD